MQNLLNNSKMKVYQAVTNPYATFNQYVVTLMEEICRNHPEVQWGWGVDKFWQDDIFNYDIIHIQWPHMLLGNGKTTFDVFERLNELKKRNVFIVATCHNLEAHYCYDVNVKSVYNITYSTSDMIFHMGEYSRELFLEKYPNAVNVILPHHIYDTFYSYFPNKNESCRKLKLRESRTYVLCFGAFRDEEEKEMAMYIGGSFKKRNIYVLAPSYERIQYRNVYEKTKCRIKTKVRMLTRHLICYGYANGKVPNEYTPYYYGASDVAMIQRKKILNSGNVPLAFLMGKVVVGPNCGNVGLLLKETGNPTFDVNDDKTILYAVEQSLELAKNNYGEYNRQYALKNFSTVVIAEHLYRYYLMLF